jgi:hypothetical protein
LLSTPPYITVRASRVHGAAARVAQGDRRHRGGRGVQGGEEQHADERRGGAPGREHGADRDAEHAPAAERRARREDDRRGRKEERSAVGLLEDAGEIRRELEGQRGSERGDCTARHC